MRRLWPFAFLAACGGAPEPATEAPAASALFDEAAEASGLDFQHFIGATGDYLLPEIMGAGVGLLDYDGDGDLDAFFPQGAMLDPAKTPADSIFPAPERLGGRLYRNDLSGGDLRFTDVTEASGIRQAGYGMGVAVGDYDNDGDPDLYLTAFGPNALYRNNGDGTFTDVTTAGLDDDRWSSSAAFLDYDRDGDLDLFVANYVDFTVENNKQCYDRTGARDYCTPKAYNPVPDRLLRNDGGRFIDVTSEAGIDAAYGNGLGLSCADFDGDGWIDIYVANDAVANQLWRNDRAGGFVDVALSAGVAFNADGLAEAGMGVGAADFDGDGDEDLFLTHLTRETNTLYLNDGSGRFRDATNRLGLGSPSMPYTGFGADWFDFDHDGRLDLFVANGGVTIEESQRGAPYPFRQRNQLYRGSGASFDDVSAQSGEALALEEVSRGAAFGDVDRDGDIDVVVSNNNGPARLLLNRQNDDNGVHVHLEGVEDNRDGLGAHVALLVQGGATMRRRVRSDGSYLSASSPAVHFGVAAERSIEAIDVVWPNGSRERFKFERGRATPLRQGSGAPWANDR